MYFISVGLESSEPSQRKMTRTQSDSKIRLRGQSIPIPGVRQALSPIMSPRHSMDWLMASSSKPELELNENSSDGM